MTKLKTFAFDIHRDLPIIAQAFMNGELQFQTGRAEQCSYEGPCGLGVCIPEADREWFDNPVYLDETGEERECEGSGATTLFDQKIFTAPDNKQMKAFADIQDTHDGLVGGSDGRDDNADRQFRKALERTATKFNINLSAILTPAAMERGCDAMIAPAAW